MKTFIKSKKFLVFIILILVSVPVVFYYYTQYKKEQLQNSTGTKAQQNLIDSVGNLILLPQGNPRIATVTDASKLPNQPFFANAQNGDKVLIYDQAGEAILYRPGINKIVNVAALNIVGNIQPTPTSLNSTPSVPKVLHNSTSSAGQRN